MSCMYCDFPNANSLRLNHHWLKFMLLAYARSIYIKSAIKALRGVKRSIIMTSVENLQSITV